MSPMLSEAEGNVIRTCVSAGCRQTEKAARIKRRECVTGEDLNATLFEKQRGKNGLRSILLGAMHKRGERSNVAGF